MLNPRMALQALEQLRMGAMCNGADHDLYREAMATMRAVVDSAERAAKRPVEKVPEKTSDQAEWKPVGAS